MRGGARDWSRSTYLRLVGRPGSRVARREARETTERERGSLNISLVSPSRLTIWRDSRMRVSSQASAGTVALLGPGQDAGLERCGIGTGPLGQDRCREDRRTVDRFGSVPDSDHRAAHRVGSDAMESSLI